MAYRKSLSSLLLCGLLLLFLLFGFLLSAVAYESPIITHPVEGGNLHFNKNTGTINRCDKTVTSAVVPDTIQGIPVVGIDGSAFLDCSLLKSVSLPDGIPELKSHVFYSCSALESIVIPQSVTKIGECAFSYCESLKTITVPGNVTRIDDMAFGACYGLESITLSYGVISVGESAFAECHSLTNISLPNSLQVISPFAFLNCHSLTSITLPESMTKISVSTFRSCENLSEVNLPNTITNIDNYAFSQCTGLKDITIPSSVERIGKYTFDGCSGLTRVTIPEGVTMLDDCAFWNCTNLTGIVLPESLNTINGSVFRIGCDRLRVIYYCGTEAQWQEITKGPGNQILNSLIILYQYDPNAPFNNSPFSDVAGSDYFAPPVLWAVEQGITTGTSADRFSPLTDCTRSQVVTFLWRAAGSPEPTSLLNPFKDVLPEDYYYTAVLWAVEQGITTGTRVDTFSPNSPCTRGQVATFLWRGQGNPEATATNPFTDLDPQAYYYTPVLWAVEQGITTGMSLDTFAPSKICTRGQIVTFLYRAMT